MLREGKEQHHTLGAPTLSRLSSLAPHTYAQLLQSPTKTAGDSLKSPWPRQADLRNSWEHFGIVPRIVFSQPTSPQPGKRAGYSREKQSGEIQLLAGRELQESLPLPHIPGLTRGPFASLDGKQDELPQEKSQDS